MALLISFEDEESETQKGQLICSDIELQREKSQSSNQVLFECKACVRSSLSATAHQGSSSSAGIPKVYHVMHRCSFPLARDRSHYV